MNFALLARDEIDGIDRIHRGEIVQDIAVGVGDRDVFGTQSFDRRLHEALNAAYAPGILQQRTHRLYAQNDACSYRILFGNKQRVVRQNDVDVGLRYVVDRFEVLFDRLRDRVFKAHVLFGVRRRPASIVKRCERIDVRRNKSLADKYVPHAPRGAFVSDGNITVVGHVGFDVLFAQFVEDSRPRRLVGNR